MVAGAVKVRHVDAGVAGGDVEGDLPRPVDEVTARAVEMEPAGGEGDIDGDGATGGDHRGEGRNVVDRAGRDAAQPVAGDRRAAVGVHAPGFVSRAGDEDLDGSRRVDGMELDAAAGGAGDRLRVECAGDLARLEHREAVADPRRVTARQDD